VLAEVDALDRAGRTDACKRIYAAVTGLSEQASRGFFQARGWASSFRSAELAAAGTCPTLTQL
jgi:hypothetical protein